MAETAEVDAKSPADKSDTTLLLGRKGWALWLVIVIMNVYGGLPTVSTPVGVVAYVLFCAVGGYLIVVFWKKVLQFLGLLA